MGDRLSNIFELLVLILIFMLIASISISANVNNAITQTTESFAELVRYKGCITADSYYSFLKEFTVPVSVYIKVDKQKTISSPQKLEFMGDIATAIGSDAGIYKMNIGDSIEIVVRKKTATLLDNVLEMYSGIGSKSASPVVAIKGGLILNEQYE